MEPLMKLQQAQKEIMEKFIYNYKRDGRDRRIQPYYEKRLKEFEALWLEFKHRHQELLVLKYDIEKFDEGQFEYFRLDVFGEVEEFFFSNHALIQARYENEFPKNDQATASQSADETVRLKQSAAPVKLPKIYLEKFNAAWDLLKDRYNNPRVLVNAQLKILLGQHPVNVESSTGVKNLLDTTTECLQALKNLKIDTAKWDPIIVYLTVQKLPSETHQLWEQAIGNSKELPTWKGLQEFLESRFRTLEAVSTKNRVRDRSIPSVQHLKQKSFHTTTRGSCTNCLGNHSIRQCPNFLDLDGVRRLNVVKTKGLCINCLGSGHVLRNCPSQQKCYHCQQSHHTLLHRKAEASKMPNSPKPATQDQQISANYGSYKTTETDGQQLHNRNAQSPLIPFANCSTYPPQTNCSQIFNSFASKDTSSGSILLATAMVRIISPNGQEQVVRALIDQGSQASFLTEAIAQHLHLRKQPVNATVQGLGKEDRKHIHYRATFEIKPLHGGISIKINGFILNRLTGLLPQERINHQHWKHLKTLQLADPRFHAPGKIDLLLGSDIYGQILLDGLLKDQYSGLIAQRTTLGWILSGRANRSHEETIRIENFHICADLDEQLKKFWEIEEAGEQKKSQTDEEQCCEEIYIQTTRRLPNGRYEVALPLRKETEHHYLGRSKRIAIARLHQIHSKLQREENLKTEYKQCIEEYLTLGHMELADTREESHCHKITNIEAFSCSYLPHHCVVKETSSTTKLRVVFDASRATESGTSLNDMMYKGPVIQDELITLLLRWRRHRIAFTADIEKMYRQIRVRRDHADYQRVLWRSDSTQAILEYRLLTVTFGTKAAPFLATRTLKQLAMDERTQYPIGAKIVESDFYVDDLISGADNLQEAIEIQGQLINIMKSGGFSLRKWTSNCSKLIQALPSEPDQMNLSVKLDANETVRTLGINWNPHIDSFSYYIQFSDAEITWTKRKVLSEIAKLFDPLGFVAPIIVVAKIMMQQLWLSGIHWDDKIPANLEKEWITYRNSIKTIQTIKIDRWIHTTQATNAIEIHGFADASMKALGAVVYICAVDKERKRKVTLFTAKTRVAPLKTISLPRLELCAATLLAKLLNYVRTVLKTCVVPSLHAWTDSEIVMAWLRGHPSKWATFVANRVSHIHELLEENIWRHVPSKQNPADCASRGMLTAELREHELWWKGPRWLSQTANHWPDNKNIADTNLEKRKKVTHCLNTMILDELEGHYSSLSKLIRVTAYCFRFITRLKKQTSYRPKPYLTSSELQSALQFWIKRTQQKYLPEDIKSLKLTQSVHRNSRLLKLNPFLDEIIRVGGRLHHANLSYNEKHPIILPDKCPLVTLLIKRVHRDTCHGGPALMMATLSQKYWILNVRNVIRHEIYRCMQCFRERAGSLTQLMGDLPQVRVTYSRPFAHTGVDYCGPFELKTYKGRSHKKYKAYIAVFVCMSVEAIHLEVVTDMTTEGFIAAYRRFCARRGACSDLYSDCGSNFIGAQKILTRQQKQLIQQLDDEIAEALATEGVNFHFIPPSSPHFGGLWEAGVRSTKYHLKRVLGNTRLAYEEFSTVLTQIEACLNSRPLCEQSRDPRDLNPLTPGHFLIGEPILTPAEPSVLNMKENTLQRWQFVQKLYQTYWKRWNTEYLSRLQQRPKWTTKRTNVTIGDLVILKEENLPPSRWALARVIDVHPGEDGLVRVVTIRTKTATLKRPITKICRLPFETKLNELNN